MVTTVCKPQVIDVTCIDEDATAFATFQSHNQKIISNENGIFLTYIRTRNEAYTEQNWRILNSTDQGRTFNIMYDSVDATNPPPIETNDANDLYLIYPDFQKWNSNLMIFRSSKRYKDPISVILPNTAGGKFALAHDNKRKVLYYVPNNGDFHKIDEDGNIIHSMKLVKPGSAASFEYPHLAIDEDGVLHLAWTTNMYNTYHYLSIYYLKSEDGGYTWKHMDGRKTNVPVFSDMDEDADRVTLNEEFELNTWLSSFIPFKGKLHFIYRACPHGDFTKAKASFNEGNQHYMRFDVKTGKKDNEIVAPCLGGTNIKLASFDGFFSVDYRPKKEALYFTAKQQKRIGCIVSYDNGLSWEDYAISDELVDDPYSTYAIGGCRSVSKDGFIFGSYTERNGDYMDPFVKSKAHFLKIKVQ